MSNSEISSHHFGLGRTVGNGGLLFTATGQWAGGVGAHYRQEHTGGGSHRFGVTRKVRVSEQMRVQDTIRSSREDSM